MRLDLTGAHATRVERDDLLVEAREAALVLGDELRIEAPVTIARNRQLEFATVGENSLATTAVAVIARRLLGILTQMVIHLGIEDALG
jgi:hypothetical protein